MNWDDLRLLLAIGRSRSLAHAAKSLSVDQTTVGRRLSALETGLGARLVDRTPSGHSLTAAGRTAFAVAEEMERNALSLQQLRGIDEGLSGCIRVTTLGTLVPVLAEVGARMRATSPRLTFELLYDLRKADLIRGEADVAVRLGTMRDSGQPSLLSRKLADEDWSLWASEKYLLAHGPLTPGLREHSILAYDQMLGGLPGAVWLDEHGREAEIVVRVNNPVSAAECAALGLGLTALPASMARTAGLKRVGPVYATVGIWVMTTPAMARVPRVHAFVEQLVSEFRARQSQFTAPPMEPLREQSRADPIQGAAVPGGLAAHESGSPERKRGPNATRKVVSQQPKRQRG
jgi:DNA-binding transcriptional LysR family regulator